MTHSRAFRVLFVGSLSAAIVGMVAWTGWLVVWPAWQKHRLLRVLNGDDWQAREAVVGPLADLGGGVVPELIQALKSEDLHINSCSAKTLAKIGPNALEAVPTLVTVLRAPETAANADAQAWAAVALGAIGPDAKEAVPELLAMTENSIEISEKVPLDALMKIAPEEAVASLVTLSRNMDKGNMLRSYAEHALRQIAPDAIPNDANVIRMLAVGDSKTRWWAAWELGSRWRSCEAVSYLAAALGDAEPFVRRDAAETLSRIGPAAERAVPGLIKAVGDVDPQVREMALHALGEIHAQPIVAVPTLIDLLENGDPVLRWWASWALAKFGPDAKMALPALWAELRVCEHSSQRWYWAAEAIRKIDPEAAAHAGVK